MRDTDTMTPHTNQVVPVEPTEREKFEAHQLSRYEYADLSVNDDGEYSNQAMKSEWETWQAALLDNNWKALFNQVSLALKCLPSMFVDGNQHVIDKAEALAAAIPLDAEDLLRISKSGCSVKVGWSDEKRIVAKCPCEIGDAEGFKQWMIDAERLCDGWNRRAAAPQQQGEPVYLVPIEVEGHDVLFRMQDHPEPRCDNAILYPQPLTADASFNQGVEAAMRVCRLRLGRAAAAHPDHIKSESLRQEFIEACEICERDISELKRPTDMVTMTRPQLEDFAFSVVHYLRLSDSVVLMDKYGTIEVIKAVSRALEGK